MVIFHSLRCQYDMCYLFTGLKELKKANKEAKKKFLESQGEHTSLLVKKGPEIIELISCLTQLSCAD